MIANKIAHFVSKYLFCDQYGLKDFTVRFEHDRTLLRTKYVNLETNINMNCH